MQILRSLSSVFTPLRSAPSHFRTLRNTEYFWLHEKSAETGRPGRWRLRTRGSTRRGARHTQVQGRISECTFELGRAVEELAKTLERFRDDARTAAWGAGLKVEWHIADERRPALASGSADEGWGGGDE